MTTHDQSQSVTISKKKSIIIAYLLWLFGGIFGFHHLYLNRYRHAFVWWCTLGGYFGIGWAFEVFKITGYVKYANEEQSLLKSFSLTIKKYPKPPFSIIRFLGSILIGYLFGELMNQAIPQNIILGINWTFLHWLVPLAMALGIWTVGNIGREKGVLWQCLIAAYITYPVRYHIYDQTTYMSIVLFSTAFVFDHFSKQWRQKTERKSNLKDLIILFFAVILYIMLWGCYLYFNGNILGNDGEEISVQDAVRHFFSSSIWFEFKNTVFEAYRFGQHHGWLEVVRLLLTTINEDAEQNSFKVLNISPGASQIEITTAWRKLSKLYHPDKQQDAAKRKMVQDHFMEIQKAYEILSKNKMRRKTKNKKFNDDL